MVFQKIDSLHTGLVHIDDLVEALLRVRQPVQGLDVAAAKSAMRRLVADGITLKQQSNCVSSLMTHTVERLRLLHIVERSDQDEEFDFSEMMGLKQGVIQFENDRLRAKCDNLRKHIVERRKNLIHSGFVGEFGASSFLGKDVKSEIDMSPAPDGFD